MRKSRLTAIAGTYELEKPNAQPDVAHEDEAYERDDLEAEGVCALCRARMPLRARRCGACGRPTVAIRSRAHGNLLESLVVTLVLLFFLLLYVALRAPTGTP